MRVTVYLPPNLVGLKISELTVAMAGHELELPTHAQLGMLWWDILRED